MHNASFSQRYPYPFFTASSLRCPSLFFSIARRNFLHRTHRPSAFASIFPFATMVYCTKQQEICQKLQRSDVATGNARWPTQRTTHNAAMRCTKCTGQASHRLRIRSFCSSQLLFSILLLRRVPNKQAWLQQTFLGDQLWEAKAAKHRKSLPPPSFDSDKLELKHIVCQLGEKIAKLQQAVGSLAELLDSQLRQHSLNAKLGDAESQHSDNKNNNNNNDNNTTDNSNKYNNTRNNNHTNNNNNNNDNNNKDSRESSLDSLDLDNENPESEPDLDTTSLVSFNPEVGSESSSWSLDHEEADLSLTNLGHTMAIGSSLRSLDQEQWPTRGEEHRDSLGTKLRMQQGEL